MKRTEKAMRWFLKHDVWLIPLCSVGLTLLLAWISNSETGVRFWVALEAMLLGFTVLYLVISYYAHYEYLNEVLKNQRSGLAGVLIVLSGLAFLVLTLWVIGSLISSSCPYPSHFFHIGLPFVSVGLAILAAYCVLGNGFDPTKIELLNKTTDGTERVQRALRYRRSYKLGLKYCDIPTLFGLALLATVVGVMYWRFGNQEGAEEMFKTFVGGTVTFHLMLSNFVFAATSGEGE